MSKCLLLQHIPAESGFAIVDALLDVGIDIDTRLLFAGDAAGGDIKDFDGLVVMGGPMSAAFDDGYPTRQEEIGLVRDAIALGVPTLGICLGAQLMAVAAGAAVYPGAVGPEIGWGPVELLPASTSDPLFAGLPTNLEVMHWHGDTFDLPVGATRLATNANYLNQAFRIGESAWGLQFHVEVTGDAVDGFVGAFPEEASLVPGGAERIRRATDDALRALQAPRDLLLHRFAALVASPIMRSDLVQLD